MISEQIPKNHTQKTLRCDERVLIPEHGKELDPVEKKDAGLKTDIANAFWKDDVLRALEFQEIDVRVQDSVVYLNGHIVGTGSQNRINTALRTVPGIVEIQNHLILDDKLTLNAAAALGDLEHTYGCKFFTGASHGVVSLNGSVKDKNVRLLAEKCVSENPDTRGVINNVQILGHEQVIQDHPFLQPAIGQTIYFLDWAFGVVQQVIINPTNRLVIAMIVRGKFPGQQLDSNNSGIDANTFPVERSIVIPISTVRHLTRTSGFLNINSSQKNRYMDLSLIHFINPPESWVPPYPYCPDDVLFPMEYKDMTMQIEYKPDQYSFAKLSKDTPLGEQLLANDSLGG